MGQITPSILYPPPLRGTKMSVPEQHYMLSLQHLLPLYIIDTTAGNLVLALPPAGLNSSTGQSNQNQEISYIKRSTDANTATIEGAQFGAVVLFAQGDKARFKSDGTVWWPI